MDTLLMEQKRYAEPMEYFADSLDINVLSNNMIAGISLISPNHLKFNNNLNQYFNSTIPLPIEDVITKALYSDNNYRDTLFSFTPIVQNGDRKYETMGEGYLDTDFYSTNILKRSGNISEKDNLSKSDEELFKELYDSFEVPDIKEFNSQEFIRKCEAIYKISTEEFIKEFTANDFEGNVDQQLWFHHAKLLKDDGETI